jgi:hypothetical protein
MHCREDCLSTKPFKVSIINVVSLFEIEPRPEVPGGEYVQGGELVIVKSV